MLLPEVTNPMIANSRNTIPKICARRCTVVIQYLRGVSVNATLLDRDAVDLLLRHRAVACPSPCAADLLHYIETFRHLPEDRVLVVEVWRRAERDEELRAACIRARVSHRQDAGAGVPEIFVEFVLDRVTGAAAAGTLGIAALNHEAIDHTVEDGAVVETLLREVDEVLGCNGGLVLEKLDLERARCGIEGCRTVCHLCLLSNDRLSSSSSPGLCADAGERVLSVRATDGGRSRKSSARGRYPFRPAAPPGRPRSSP